jgi:chromosome segregation ATPase
MKNKIKELEEKLLRKEQELNDYKKQFKADTKEMEDYQNEITRNLESIEYWQRQAEAKEQECEELKKIIDEAKNSKLDLKSFLVGEAVQNEYEQLLDQLKAQYQEAETLKAGRISLKLEEQTLIEIKEFIENEMTPNGDTYIILQKINEVLDATK